MTSKWNCYFFFYRLSFLSKHFLTLWHIMKIDVGISILSVGMPGFNNGIQPDPMIHSHLSLYGRDRNSSYLVGEILSTDSLKFVTK